MSEFEKQQKEKEFLDALHDSGLIDEFMKKLKEVRNEKVEPVEESKKEEKQLTTIDEADLLTRIEAWEREFPAPVVLRKVKAYLKERNR